MSPNVNSFGSGLGTLIYNGYEFGASASIKVESTPVRDEAERTVVYVQHSITVHETVSAFDSDGQTATQDETTTSSYMENVRRLLMQDGQQLSFISKGFAEPLIVDGIIVADVRFGPRTRMLAWEPAGGNRSVEFIWNVTFCLPQCSLGLQDYTGVLAFNYDISFDQDQHGMTMRTISGYLQIALTRLVGGKIVPDSADLYWDSIAWPVNPLGYKRQHRRSISKDKARMDFTIVDTQIASNNPWPPYCTDARGSHHVRWARSESSIYRAEIEMTLTLQAGIPGAVAFNYFNLITADRMLESLNQGRKAMLIQEIEVNEDLFGLTHNFRIAYSHLNPIKDFLKDNALFMPVQGDWRYWATTLRQSMFAKRGLSQLAQFTDFDAIVDLCPGSEMQMPRQEGSLIPVAYQSPGAPPKNKVPSPGESWLHYNADFSMRNDSQTARQRFLQKGPPPSEKSDPNNTAPYSDPPPSSGSGKPDAIIQRGLKSWRLIFSGSAVRAGYPVSRPAVKSIGENVTLIEDEAQYDCKIVSNALGVPIYAATWEISYYMPNIGTGNVLPPENPREMIDDNFQVTQDGMPADSNGNTSFLTA